MSENIVGADAFLALTDADEENILLSLYAKEHNHGKIVTKIKRIDYDDVIDHLELDTVIYPKNITANIIKRYVRSMKNTQGSNIETLYNVIKNKIEASEFIVSANSPIIGKPLAEIRMKKNILIAAILRGRSVITPRGSDSIQPKDRVVVVAPTMLLHDIADILE